MRPPNRMISVLTIASGVLLGITPAVAQTTRHVDDDSCPGPGSGTEADPICLIQDCIGAAMDGDECVVAPGTYFENINLLGKAITLRSSGGASVTTIDATRVADPGDGKPVVRCDNGEGADTVLDGFTIKYGLVVCRLRQTIHLKGAEHEQFEETSRPVCVLLSVYDGDTDGVGGLCER